MGSLARSKKIMAAAKGQDCTLRLVGICNFNPETTVAAHVGRRRGMACKSGDNMVVFACYDCHNEIDSNSKSKHSFDLLKGLEETQEILIGMGIIKIS